MKENITENMTENTNNLKFPACTYLLGLGGLRDDNSIVAFENVLNESNIKRGLLLVKISENKENNEQEAMLITPKAFSNDREGLQLGDKLVNFADTYLEIENIIYEYKNIEIACKDEHSMLVTKDKKEELLKLNNKVIEFLKMNLVANTLKIVIIDKKLALSSVSIRNVVPIDATINWSEEIIYEKEWKFEMGNPDTEISDSQEHSKWISENSYLIKDNQKYPLSRCELSQLNDKIYLVIKESNNDDILIGYITHPISDPTNKELKNN